MSQSTSAQPQPSSLTRAFRNVSNYFKPHRAEAFQRIRVNTFGFILILIFSNLLPLPSLQSALWVVTSSSRSERWSSDSVYRWLCILEVAVAALLAFNVLEGVRAVKYPRPPLPPYASPAKTKALFKAAPSPQRPFKILSPHTSPQVQRPFSAPSSGSLSASSSIYPASPLSSPSKIVYYPPIPATPANTQASSTSTMAFMSTPSPVISAYRGKHASSVGRAIDDSFLEFIPSKTEKNEEE